jgi:hypothetical protein
MSEIFLVIRLPPSRAPLRSDINNTDAEDSICRSQELRAPTCEEAGPVPVVKPNSPV